MSLPVLRKAYIDVVFNRIPDRRSDLLDRQLIECLKFLVICSSTSGRRIAVTPEVDVIWHELILQTSSYMTMCSAMPGQRYLHHASISPDAYAALVGEDEFIREFVQWIPDYVQNFGPFDEERASMWTVTEFLSREMRMSLDSINEMGLTEVAQVLLPMDSPWRQLGTAKGIYQLIAS